MLALVTKACLFALLIGGIGYVAYYFIIKKAPASVPDWAKWLGGIVIGLLTLAAYLGAMGWGHYVGIR